MNRLCVWQKEFEAYRRFCNLLHQVPKVIMRRVWRNITSCEEKHGECQRASVYIEAFWNVFCQRILLKVKYMYCDTNVSFIFHFLGSVGVVVHIKCFKEFILWLSIDVAIYNTMRWNILYFTVIITVAGILDENWGVSMVHFCSIFYWCGIFIGHI
jgi:hypothetical protein